MEFSTSRKFTAYGITYEFSDTGMVQKILLPEEFDNNDLLLQPMMWDIRDENGNTMHIKSTNISETNTYNSSNGAEVIEFTNLEVGDFNDLFLNLKYDIFPDGTFFANTVFFGNTCSVRKISKFELKINLAFAKYPSVNFDLAYRPAVLDGTLIQTSAPERDLPKGSDREQQGVFPKCGFVVQSAEGPSFYAEFFVEADGSLAGKAKDTASSVKWHDGNALISFDFQTTPDIPDGGVWQWRNQIGWVIAPAPKVRHLPPLSMYHYFDNFERFPSDEVLEAIAANGTDVLILHENWRGDVQNGGLPFNRKRLKEVVDAVHAKNMRIALYIRGNELACVEDRLDWYFDILQPNWDGLYMDYGGPFCYIQRPNEVHPKGRIHFRHHYNESILRRKLIGRDAVIFNHTGPMFSAVGMTNGTIDGYVSGEGERGLLIKGRHEHLYFSMAPVCTGSMWTAAFPEYGTQEMVPFLAATGQFPHIPLGTQFKTSSLSHPNSPGINDKPFIPLLRLWQLLKGSKDLAVFNDYNSRGIFPKTEKVSHYMMIDNDRAVCIYANFSHESTVIDTSIDFTKTNFDPEGKEKRLCMDFKANKFDGTSFELAPLGVAAVTYGKFDFDFYERPQYPLTKTAQKYLETIESQRKMRYEVTPAEELFLKVTVPDIPLPYESSMIIDLYDNRFILGEFDGNNEFKRIGYITKNGFQTEEPPRTDFVVNGESSPWIDLKKIFGTGHHKLGIWSLHRGEKYYINTPFYSFIEAEISRDSQNTDYTIRFINELEEDRAFLRFDIDIK